MNNPQKKKKRLGGFLKRHKFSKNEIIVKHFLGGSQIKT